MSTTVNLTSAAPSYDPVLLLGSLVVTTNPNVTNGSVTLGISALGSTTISSNTGSSVTVNLNVTLADPVMLDTNNGNITLASTLLTADALSGVTVNISGGSFTIASSLITANVLSSVAVTFGTAGGTLDLTSSGTGTLTLGTALAAIQGFTSGSDIINDGALAYTGAGSITGYTITGSTGATGVQVVTITDANGTSLTFDVEGSNLTNGTYTGATGPLHFASDGAGGTDIALCLLGGTMLATPNGPRAVETLEAGDLVLTDDGEVAPVRWLGQSRVSTRFADPLRSLPIRIAAGALAENVPSADLLVSPDHALFLDGLLVQASALVDGQLITRETQMPERFTYYHVELPTHALMMAQNTPVESFVDNVDRMHFDNWQDYLRLRETAAETGELPYPRVKSRRQIPAALRERLAARAALLLGRVHAA